MLFRDASSGKILYRKFVKNETNRDYLDGLQYIAERGTMIKAVVCDGHVGLLQAISFYPVQMCQFHQFQIVSRPLKTIFQHKVCTDKLYADSFYKAQKSSHSSFEVICCRS